LRPDILDRIGSHVEDLSAVGIQWCAGGVEKPSDCTGVASDDTNVWQFGELFQGRIFLGGHLAKIRNGVEGDIGSNESFEYSILDVFWQHLRERAPAVQNRTLFAHDWLG